MQKRGNNIRITVDVKNGDGIVDCFSTKQPIIVPVRDCGLNWCRKRELSLKLPIYK